MAKSKIKEKIEKYIADEGAELQKIKDKKQDGISLLAHEIHMEQEMTIRLDILNELNAIEDEQ